MLVITPNCAQANHPNENANKKDRLEMGGFAIYKVILGRISCVLVSGGSIAVATASLPPDTADRRSHARELEVVLSELLDDFIESFLAEVGDVEQVVRCQLDQIADQHSASQ